MRRCRSKLLHRTARQAAGGRWAHALTLPEVLIAAAVLSIVVIGLSHAVASGQAQTYNALHEARALALAQALMEEVLARPYNDPGGDTAIGPDVGEVDRNDFDAVDDFDGYEEAADALADHEAVLYGERFQAFERSVSVEADSVSLGALAGDQDGLTVTVTVAEPGGRSWTISRFVAEPAE